jgi:hypothetical protein
MKKMIQKYLKKMKTSQSLKSLFLKKELDETDLPTAS